MDMKFYTYDVETVKLDGVDVNEVLDRAFQKETVRVYVGGRWRYSATKYSNGWVVRKDGRAQVKNTDTDTARRALKAKLSAAQNLQGVDLATVRVQSFNRLRNA